MESNGNQDKMVRIHESDENSERGNLLLRTLEEVVKRC
jgi:hypothetical protein